MSEFKGTKGKWELKPMTNRIIVGKNIADVWGFDAHIDNKANEEMKANALLISKAPEMLQELIKEVEILKSMGLGDTERCKRKEQLIKEATEL